MFKIRNNENDVSIYQLENRILITVNKDILEQNQTQAIKYVGRIEQQLIDQIGNDFSFQNPTEIGECSELPANELLLSVILLGSENTFFDNEEEIRMELETCQPTKHICKFASSFDIALKVFKYSWTGEILEVMTVKPRHFKDILDDIDFLSQVELSRKLKLLVDSNVIEKDDTGQYALTKHGIVLKTLIQEYKVLNYECPR